MEEGWKSSSGGRDDVLIIWGEEEGLTIEEDWIVGLLV